MTTRGRAWAAIVLLALVAACAPGDGDGAPADAEAAPSAAGTRLTPAAVLIGHRVADYEKWKSAFEGHQQAREDATCLGHYLKRGVDDEDMVYVYCLATDAQKLEAFLGSADLADAMRDAGVQGTPEITLMQPMVRDLVPQQRLPGIIVLHAVEDYDRWRAEYDALDGFRRQSGIVGHAVGRRFDDPNRVVVYHQANAVDDLRAFVDSAELADAMRRGGVVGTPDIRFIRVVDFATY